MLAEHPLCAAQAEAHPNVVRPSTVADHVVSLRDWERDERAAAQRLAAILRARGVAFTLDELHPWSLKNGQGMDQACHAAKSGREAHDEGSRR